MLTMGTSFAKRRLRILHAPTDVGNPWAISQAERALGHFSRVIVYVQHNQGFQSDYNLHFERYPKIIDLARAIRFFLFAIRNFDVFHFYFSTTFFPNNIDIPILHSLGKKIFFTFQGCDIRPTEACFSARLNPKGHRHAPNHVQRRRLRYFLRYASQTYVSTPDLLAFSPDSKLSPPISVDLNNWKPHYRSYRAGEEVMLFHAPTDPIIKGTKHIERAVAKLQGRGYKIRLDMPKRVPHKELYARAAQAHLTVDQVLVGWYGSFGIEMMALGKPLLCYIKNEYIDLLPEYARKDFPVINVTTSTLVNVLEDLLKHPERWEGLGRRGRTFIERAYNPMLVAQQLITDYARSFESPSPPR